MSQTRRPSERRKPLPPLDYLLAFEAAAEHESFASAARQINISETAISRKVRLLEQHFGLPFFARGHRSIELTPHGREFLSRIAPALELLRDVGYTEVNVTLARRRQPVAIDAALASLGVSYV